MYDTGCPASTGSESARIVTVLRWGASGVAAGASMVASGTCRRWRRTAASCKRERDYRDLDVPARTASTSPRKGEFPTRRWRVIIGAIGALRFMYNVSKGTPDIYLYTKYATWWAGPTVPVTVGTRWARAKPRTRWLASQCSLLSRGRRHRGGGRPARAAVRHADAGRGRGTPHRPPAAGHHRHRRHAGGGGAAAYAPAWWASSSSSPAPGWPR